MAKSKRGSKARKFAKGRAGSRARWAAWEARHPEFKRGRKRRKGRAIRNGGRADEPEIPGSIARKLRKGMNSKHGRSHYS